MAKAKLLTRAQINAKCALPFEIVEVPEWGGAVKITAISSADRDTWEKLAGIQSGVILYDHFRANLVALCLIDDDGRRVYSDEEIEELGAQPAVLIDRLFDVASRLSGLGKYRFKPAGEAVKNSKGTNGANSSSGSPSRSASQAQTTSNPN